jgi:hypothetical protein
MSENPSCRPRELDSRANAGIQVELWWSPADGRTWVTVRGPLTRPGVLPVQDVLPGADAARPTELAGRRASHV